MDNALMNFFTAQISYDWAALLLRLAIGLALLPYGIAKIRDRHEKAAHFPAVLFFRPETAFYLALLIETFASICVILGFCTRLACLPAIVNMGIATNVSRGKELTSPAQPYFLGFIAILCVGPGAFSLDDMIFGG